MKRLLTIATIGAALTLFGTSTNSSAADFFGGHGGHHGVRHHGYSHGLSHHNYGQPSYGYQNFGNQGYGNVYGSNRVTVPSYGYGSGYAPAYGAYGRSRSYGHGHGGLHLDIGRFHIGVGGHH